MTEFPAEFNRFKPAGSNAFFQTLKHKTVLENLRSRLLELCGEINEEVYLKISQTALESGLQPAIDAYLESVADQPAIAELSNNVTSEKQLWTEKRRLLGSVQADIWCTRSGTNLLQFGEHLRIERHDSKHKFRQRSFQSKEDFLTRVYNEKGLDVARLSEEDSRFVAVLLDADVAWFDATVIFAEQKLKIGSTVTVQLNCYLKSSAFSAAQSFPINNQVSSPAIVNEAKESLEERFVRLRQQALVHMFRKLGVGTPPPDQTVGEQVGNVDEDELSQRELDIFYNNGINGGQNGFEPELETEPPRETFNLNLFPYQRRGLTWLLQREKLGSNLNEEALAETHPLWTEAQWQEGDKFYINFNSGELSLSRPTLALKCRGGILADDMGLGKTISTLALIHTSAKENPGECTLIVAPTTLLAQWEAEVNSCSVKNQCGVFVYYRTNQQGSARNLQRALQQFVKNSNFPFKVVLTTYGMVSSEHKTSPTSGLFALNFNRIVLDEAHHIKNRNTRAAKSCFDLKGSKRWALTGTPVVNRLEDLYSLIRYIGLEPWNNFSFWRAFVTLKFQSEDTRMLAMKTVQSVVSPITLRRTKAMKDPKTNRPLVELPEKLVEIKRVQFSEAEKTLYSHLYAKIQKSVKSTMQRGLASAKYSAILTLLLRLRQACCHPLLLKGTSDSSTMPPPSKRAKPNNQLELEEEAEEERDELALDLSGDLEQLLQAFSETPSLKYTTETLAGLLDNPLEEQECVICSENHSEPVLTECLHAACRDCMMAHIDYMKGKGEDLLCAVCRAPISPNRLYTVDRNRRALVPLDSGLQSTKIRALLNSLKEASQRGLGKSVVFSQFTSFLDLIQRNLKNSGFTVFRFDGSMTPAQRSEAQESFKNSKDKNAVLLLSQKAGGVGLNLVAANHAYLMDPWWNYASESQAIDRIYRLGQTRNVVITRFIIQGSIEERILKIQEHKRVLSNLVTEEERRAVNLENIRMLFEIDELGNDL